MEYPVELKKKHFRIDIKKEQKKVTNNTKKIRRNQKKYRNWLGIEWSKVMETHFIDDVIYIIIIRCVLVDTTRIPPVSLVWYNFFLSSFFLSFWENNWILSIGVDKLVVRICSCFWRMYVTKSLDCAGCRGNLGVV